MRPEELLDASAAPNLACGAQGGSFDSPSLRSPFPYNFAIMKNVFTQCVHSESVALIDCLLSFHFQKYSWQL